MAYTISKVAVRADGWSVDVTIAGASAHVGSGSNVYDFGTLDDSPATTTSPTFTVTVVSEGYSSSGVLGTVTRTLYGTHVVRKAYPNQASKDETTSGSDMVVRVALSECIYNDDRNNGAGTSGTDPVVSISANWFVNGANNSNALTSYSIATADNASALDYPKVIAQWACGHTPVFSRVTAVFTIGCIAYHGHGVACVTLSATDAHAHAVSGTVTTKTDHTMSASGLHYESYDLSVPVSSFTDGDNVTLRYIAYPTVGDADSILDTSTNTNAYDAIRGLAQITCTYKTTATTKYVADAGHSGSDSNSGDTSGAPYLTIGKALEAGADIVLIVNGSTLDVLGKTPSAVPSKDYWVEVKPDTGATVTLTRGDTFRAYGTKRLAYIGFTSIAKSGTDPYFNGGTADRMLKFENCTMSGLQTATSGPAYGSYGVWFVNCNLGDDNYLGWSAKYHEYSFTGCSFAPTVSRGAESSAFSTLVACKADCGGGTDRVRFMNKIAGQLNLHSANVIVSNNKLIGKTSSNGILLFGQEADAANIDGLAVIGNIIESMSGTQHIGWIAADGSMRTVNNVVFAHNTLAGQRLNFCYNDSGTTANVRTNVFFRNNALNAFAIKSDTFGTQNANRIGNWAQMNGVNFSDNRYSYQSSYSTFNCDYNGINVKYEDTGELVANDLGFTDDNSAYGDGTGNGNYMPTAVSVLYNHPLRVCYLKYDQNGTVFQ